MTLALRRDGAQHFPSTLSKAAIAELCGRFADLAARPGTRLESVAALDKLLAPADAIGAGLMGPSARSVRATFFDKSADANWALGWHQDRTIAVRARVETPGFSAWTLKAGMTHVVLRLNISSAC